MVTAVALRGGVVRHARCRGTTQVRAPSPSLLVRYARGDCVDVGACFEIGKGHSGMLQRGKRLLCRAEGEESQPEESVTTTETPEWIKREKMRESADEEGGSSIPWPLFLVFSLMVSIAAIGSIFEWIYGNPIFGVVDASSPVYTPILGFFSITGIPMAGYLFKRGIDGANAYADKVDKLDGM